MSVVVVSLSIEHACERGFHSRTFKFLPIKEFRGKVGLSLNMFFLLVQKFHTMDRITILLRQTQILEEKQFLWFSWRKTGVAFYIHGKFVVTFTNGNNQSKDRDGVTTE